MYSRECHDSVRDPACVNNNNNIQGVLRTDPCYRLHGSYDTPESPDLVLKHWIHLLSNINHLFIYILSYLNYTCTHCLSHLINIFISTVRNA